MKKIVIVGAGYAGILTAKKLAKKLKKNEEVEITLIDKNSFHTMLTELHEVAAGRVEEDSIKISLAQVFAGRKVNVKLDTISKIDFKNKVVKGVSDAYDYDYLVLAAGSQPNSYGVKGVDEFTYKLWSYEDAILLKDRILNMFRKASCERSEEERRKLLSFYIVGAGFTGVEMAGELAEYVPFLCERFEIDPKEVSMNIADMLKRPIPNLPEKLSDKVSRRLKKMNVNLLMEAGVSEVGEDFIEISIGGETRREIAGTVVWGAGIQSCDLTEAAADKLEKQRGGRIPVDPYLRATEDESVYVIGDNMYYVPEGEEAPVPQMVENCEQSAHTAAHNIVAAVTGKGEMEEYKPKFHGVMVCVGGRYGAAHVGLPGHFFSLPSFLAMLSKHFINVIYFIQVLGWNKVFSYVKHEFFTIRNRRSFLGGHFSNRTPSFLLVPLRIWLGAVWVFEGVMKIFEGWFQEPKLTGFFGGAASWYESILNPGSDATSAATTASSGQSLNGILVAAADTVSAATSSEAAQTVTDAVSQATEAATGTTEAAAAVGHAIINWDILGLLRIIFVSGTELKSSTLNDLALWINIPLLDAFLDKFVLPYDNVQLVMQIFIVVAEILVGLALMGGFFTSPAAAVSLVLQMMFVTTTGLYLGTFWMVFAGIAVLIGAGKTFGIDYYAGPLAKKWWKKLPIVRRLYLYND
ncbi:MAG: FAD-dependent oxidoreductase [Lachnospiraceae bacterium]